MVVGAVDGGFGGEAENETLDGGFGGDAENETAATVVVTSVRSGEGTGHGIQQDLLFLPRKQPLANTIVQPPVTDGRW